MSRMKRATVTIPDDLDSALGAYAEQQEVEQPLAAIVQAALREFLADRGFFPKKPKKPFQLTPAKKPSGHRDTSVRHDAVLAEAAFAERKRLF